MFKKISIHFIAIVLFVIPIALSAQITGTPDSQTSQQSPVSNAIIKIENPFRGGNDLMALIVAILNRVIMPVASVGVVVWIIWAGFQFVLAQGKPAEIQKAKDRLLWSLIGAGVLLGAAGIAKVVETTVRELIR